MENMISSSLFQGLTMLLNILIFLLVFDSKVYFKKKYFQNKLAIITFIFSLEKITLNILIFY